MEINATVNPTGNIAIIEDDASMREALSLQLETAGYRVDLHPSAESFLMEAGSRQFDSLVVDLCLPKMNGLQLLAQLKRSIPFVSIVLITGHGDMSTGVRAMREGAVDCPEKPIDDQTLLQAMARAADLSCANGASHLWRLELQRRESSLTRREREVFGLISIRTSSDSQAVHRTNWFQICSIPRTPRSPPEG